MKQVRESFNSELFWEHESHLHRSSLSQHWKDVLVLKFVYSRKSTEEKSALLIQVPHLVNQAWDTQFLMKVNIISAEKKMAVDFNSNNFSITIFLYFGATWM